MLQTGTGASMSVSTTTMAGVQHVLHKHADSLKGVLTPRQRRTLTSFVQQQAPASGEIFGILKQMKESFETNLANSQKEETTSQSDFENLKAAKESEISAGQDQTDTKTQELATTDEKNAQSKENLEDTREVLAADTEFLSSLKQQCQNVDQEFEERTKTRQLEIQATSKALAFLSSDEAHDLFSRTLNFVQKQSTQHSARRVQVSKALAAASQKFSDPRLSALAVQAKLDAFAKVKASISDMVEKLNQEQADEVKHKDFCVEELNNNERDTENKNRDKSDLEATIEDLGMTVDTLGKELETLKKDIADLQVQMKRAGEDREKQNKEFQTTVADQRATQKLLTVALNILKGFYDKAALVQKESQTQPAGPPPPAGFKTYTKSGTS